MKLNKRDLARKLGCSERALTTWQQQGLPILESGRRGQSNTYDLAAVVAWIKSTGAGLVNNTRVGRTPINIAALERELPPSIKATAEEIFDYLTEHGRVPLAARFYGGCCRDVDWALELAGDCYDVFWNLLVDRFGTTDFAKKSEALLNPLYDRHDPDHRGLVARIYAAAATEKAERTPELALGPPVQTSELTPPDNEGNQNGLAGVRVDAENSLGGDPVRLSPL